jgi:3-oxoacyl-[acyl-carrier protein] reductase
VDLGLKDKVALVTASSKGLGAATAMQFAREGAKVAMCARSKELLVERAAEIKRETGVEPLIVEADLTRGEDVKRVVAATKDAYGRIDTLFINAGGPPPGLFADLDEEAWQGAVELTLMSAVRLVRETLPSMREQGEGSIIACTSVSVKQPVDGLMLSNALRMGVTGMLKTLSNEVGPEGIRVNMVLPGWTKTQRAVGLLESRAEKAGTTEQEQEEQMTAQVPLRRMGRPDEFARAAVFLASPAASYITGVSLLVDGGIYKGSL